MNPALDSVPSDQDYQSFVQRLIQAFENAAKFVARNQQAKLFGLFLRLGPPRFTGREGPDCVEDMLRSLDKIFEVMHCNDAQRVLLASYRLTEDADYWWEEYWKFKSEEEREALTWKDFKSILMEKYYPESHRRKKEIELLELQQGEMTVREYDRKFTRLYVSVPYLFNTDYSRAERFKDGLRPEIRCYMAIRDMTSHEAYLIAQRIEASMEMERSRKRKLGDMSEDESEKVEYGVANSTSSLKPLCNACGKGHRGQCLAGRGVCFRCHQPGHKSQNCPKVAHKG